MRRIVFLMMIVTGCLLPMNAWASPLTCIDYRGYQVHWIEDGRVGTVAQAGFTFNGAPYIKYKADALAEQDANVKLFFQTQECGRHVLGNTLTDEESYEATARADCWAAVHLKIGKNMSSDDLAAIQEGLVGLTPADWDQVSGPQRVIDLKECLKKNW